MKTFKMHNDDLVFDDTRNLVLIEGIDEIRQSVERICTTNIEEWFLDIDFGLDYQEIQGKRKTNAGIEIALKEAIFQDSRIEEVNMKEINLDRANRHLVVKLDAIVDRETIEIEVII